MYKAHWYTVARETDDEREERLKEAGSWLAAELKKRSWSQKYLSEQLEVSQQQVSLYIKGRYEVDAGRARDLARLFGMSEYEVWRGLQLPQPAGPPDEEAIRQAFRDFPEVMAKVPEIYERITGEKLTEPPPVTGGSGDRRTTDTRKGERRRKTDPGRESAV